MNNPDLSDGALIARLLAGDDSALARIYECYGSLVFGLARRVTGSESIASELSQDVFVFLWQNPDRVDLGRGTLRAYLGMITHRRAVDAVRSMTRRTALERRVAAAADDTDPGTEHECVESTTAAWQAATLHSMIDTLPTDQREALTLAYFDGCTYREVATKLGIPEGTAKSRLRLALARLRSLIENQPEEAWR